jgi:hypothetical protein
MSLWRHVLRLLLQPPRISALHELIDDMIGDRVSLGFGHLGLRAADDLAGTPQSKRNGIPKHLSSGHFPCEHTKNGNASR